MTAHHFVGTPLHPGHRRNESSVNTAVSGFAARTSCLILLFLLGVSLLHSQNPQIVPCPTPGTQDLVTIPEITRTPDGVLRATLQNVDGLRTIWGSVGIPGQTPPSVTDTRCATQYMRYYIGTETKNPKPWPAT